MRVDLRQTLVPRPCVRLIALGVLALGACRAQTAPRAVPDSPEAAPVLSPREALRTFRMPEGYRLELVASEPMVQDPVTVDFDADGRMWVVEMRGYMPNIEGTGENEPVGRVVVLEDVDDDGRMDRRTVFLDSLVLPRAVKVLERGVLVAEPPRLWLARDTTGDLRADVRELVREDYGDPTSNPEHNANGLLWGLDNWIHNARYEGELRPRVGGWEFRPTPRVGQWGVSSDDFGRLYRNYNEDPLHADLVPSHYYARHPGLSRTRGVYEALTPNVAVWPAHPTPGVNRGYREGVLRPDSTLARFTAAGAPVVYRGDRLPRELLGDVFVTEPAGNLVHRFRVREMPDGTLQGESAYQGSEFLASTDERFRPVNLATAPDGTLYVVDMYRGVIQHRRYITPFLEEQMRRRGLERPIGMGRIWRVVHQSTRRERRPRLSGLPSAELVRHLSHPNAWWRETAQRLLVERGAREVAPALRELALGAADERVRLHALWTLDGVGEVDAATLLRALADRSAHVRAAALRITEPRLAAGDRQVAAAVGALSGDPSPVVRRQLAATLGELPAAERVPALAALLAGAGSDSILVDAGISGLAGSELAVLERLVGEHAARAATGEAVRALAGLVMRSSRAADVERLLAMVGEETRPAAVRIALIEGASRALPQARRQGGREAVQAGQAGAVVRSPEGEPVAAAPTLEVSAAPQGLLAAAESSDPEVRRRAAALLQSLRWPGQTGAAAPAAVTLSGDALRRFQAGRQQYTSVCAGCHMPNGEGMTGVAKRLVGSPWVLGSPDALIRIVLHGKEGEMLMPPMRTLNDQQLAAVLTYIRNEWGNRAAPVEPQQVQQIRAATAGRTRPWTEQELRGR